MKIKAFNGKKIKIRQISKKDLEIESVKKFQNFINSLVEEDVQIRLNKKISLEEEKEFLLKQL